ncbi:MAG TPA: 16S rRNA (guanine(966)-N(2))-methyltransferase RsmD [Verrucomicrobiae bacterium]|nr:16S rRNA (guanine(966)-N(2))-methyltransferase RsmD [Verrucomicrobiae bacterium]
MRIISGIAGGRTLKTLPGLATRPTSDKVKGAIFNVLGAKISGGKVLDLYAGSGALGLEALSRGAVLSVLVDKSAQACKVIKENIEQLGFALSARVMCGDAADILAGLRGTRFDLVFIDPPYRKGLALASLKLLANGDYLTPDAVIIVESSREEQFPVELGKISLRKSSRYGDTVVWYYQPTETERRE